MWRLLLLGCVCGVAFTAGWRVEAWREGSRAVKQVVRTVTVTRAQGQISTVAAAKDAQAQARVRYVTKTLVKEVHDVLPPAVDVRFALPVGFVRLHDAAATGAELSDLPDAAGRADDAASDVAPSLAASTIVENYGECRADQARLAGLQDWLRAQAQAFDAH